jgi:hypothetical protein
MSVPHLYRVLGVYYAILLSYIACFKIIESHRANIYLQVFFDTLLVTALDYVTGDFAVSTRPFTL